jgi:hypothetical protein
MLWRKRCLAIAAVTCACCLSSSSRAAEGSSASAPPTEAPDQWYGAQILLTDGMAISQFAVAVALNVTSNGQYTNPLAVGGFATYFAGGPLVHTAHHRRAAVVLGSLGMRVGVPLVTSLIVLAVAKSANGNCSFDGCGLGFATAGYLGGMLIAAAADATLLAWEPAPSAPRPTACLPPFLPTIQLARDVDRRWLPMLAVEGSF